jgi:DNA-binding NarL/FixJ family response regulator
MRTSGSGRVRLPPPATLEVRTVRFGTEQYLLFSWESEPPRDVSALSKAEREVLSAITEGASNREIALCRGVSERTIANQVAGLLRKVGAASRYELIRRYSP